MPAYATLTRRAPLSSRRTLPVASTDGSDPLVVVALTVGSIFVLVLVAAGLAGTRGTSRRHHAVPA